MKESEKCFFPGGFEGVNRELTRVDGGPAGVTGDGGELG